ncbi:MAG: SsrA-binding protein SmpB [Myxococcales bacterium]|nr:SsrA-binding protein SmpB [Myxococcales bacterium]
MARNRDDRRVVAQNRRARYDYEIVETFEAGIALTGTEVKSLRAGHVTLGEGYVRIEGGEAWLVDVTIPEYKFGNIHNHAPRRKRKLLLHAHELEKVEAKIREKGFTAVPLELYFKGGWAKLLFGLGKGRKTIDKRHHEREKNARKELRDIRG